MIAHASDPLSHGLDLLVQMDARIGAALVGIVGTLITALSGVWLFTEQQRSRDREKEAEHRRNLAEEANANKRVKSKLAAALRAEIAVSLDRLTDYYDPATYLDMAEAYGRSIDEAGEGERGMPVGKALPERLVYETHQRDIYELPECVIRALVRHYQNDLGLATLVDAMADGTYDAVDKKRQKRVIGLYFEMGERTLRSAIEAKSMLDAYLALGPDAKSDQVLGAAPGERDGEAERLMEATDPGKISERRARLANRLGLPDPNLAGP